MRFMLIMLICFIPGILKSQHVHFIYIQNDQQQTFYVKKSGEVISSSATGFVILPKLPSGTHQFTIGFPKNQWPEYDFQVEVRSSDRGFTLKNFDEKGWGLFDLQSAEVISGRKIDPPKAQQLPEVPKSNDPFSVILASAVGDEGIRETGLIAMTVSRPMPVASKAAVAPPETVAVKAIEPDIKPKTDPPIVRAETATLVKTEVPAVVKTEVPAVVKTELPALSRPEPAPAMKTETPPVVKSETPPVVKSESPPVVKTEANRSNIRKISEVKGWKTTSLTFVDMNSSGVDTVDVLIEVDEIDNKAAAPVRGAIAAPANRANCAGIASEKDALLLRRKVLGMGGNEEMMAAIVKEVKAKCYTTENLQTLSYVFVNDQLRFRLFEESFPFIFDPANYASLERLLNSEEYISRFKALIKTN